MIIRGSLGSDRLDYVSPGIHDMLGYDPGEIVGVEGWPSAHRDPAEEEAAAAGIRSAIASGDPGFTLVQRYRSRSGDWRSLLLIGRFDAPGAEDPTYVATAIDITDRIHMEEELRAARDAAQAADHAKSEFLSLISHELKTPMTAIIGFSDLLALSDLQGGDRESVDFIVTGAHRLLGLIDRMLDYARLETGRLRVSVAPLVVEDAVREAVDRVAPLAAGQEPPATIETELEPGLLAVADRARLVAVIEDVVDNAVRHGGHGVHVRVTARSAGDDRVAIEVADDGIGIPGEKLAAVFSPLEVDGRGTGATLGLALVHRLLDAMDGSITVRSAPGSGTTATIEVPALVDTIHEDRPGATMGAER